MSRSPLTMNLLKVTQSAGVILRAHGGCIGRMRLLKLLYIAERKSLEERRRPLTYDRLCAMRHGPVLSEVYDLIKGTALGSPTWQKHFSNEGHLIREHATIPNGALSEYEITTLNDVCEQFRNYDDEDVSEYTHGFPEYKSHEDEVRRGDRWTSVPIPFSEILEVLGLQHLESEIVGLAQRDAAVDKFFELHAETA